MTTTLKKIEFGDFQTPYPLAVEVCQYLARQGVAPNSIVEPTCGKGSFLLASLRTFPDANAFGVDINPEYVTKCQAAVAAYPCCTVKVADFFQSDWPAILANMSEPILVVGNPPWVTNATLGSLGSANLPAKSNLHGHKGLDAITGKSNFDISEWMLLHFLRLLDGRRATIAMLCKTVVARKALQHAWKHNLQIASAEIRRIDASEHFNASVDACIFFCEMRPRASTTDCDVYPTLHAAAPLQTFAYHEGKLLADVALYRRWSHLHGESSYRWRSGIKHDCSKIMELSETPQGLLNGLGELVDLESDCLFPMLKSSELANGRTSEPQRWMVVPQRQIGQETAVLAQQAPKTWRYLVSHAELLDRRGSVIYRKRPRFSVFGIGGYSFSPWKIAVSGFYKSMQFVRLGPYRNKPIVLDDTGYVLACQTEEEANFLYEMLISVPAREFYTSLTFWDAKRPITTDLLSSLSLDSLARCLKREEEFNQFASRNDWATQRTSQATLFP